MNRYDKAAKEKSLAEGWADEKYNSVQIEDLCYEHGLSFIAVKKYYKIELESQE